MIIIAEIGRLCFSVIDCTVSYYYSQTQVSLHQININVCVAIVLPIACCTVVSLAVIPSADASDIITADLSSSQDVLPLLLFIVNYVTVSEMEDVSDY